MRPRPGRCNPARPCLRSPASHACHGVALVVRWECGGRGSGRHCCLAAALPLSWRGAHLPIEAHRGVTAGAQRRVQTRSRREPQLPTAARSGARRALPSPVARQPRRAREAGHGRGGSPPWTSTASWAASDRVRTASSSRDWRDRCPQEGGSAAAGGWHPPNQEITELPDYKIFFKDQVSIPLREVLPDVSPQALDLLGHFLLYPPHQRTAASQIGCPVA
nr:uncharacterized protein LOC108403702 isoform X2 [Manis javanica]